MNNFFEFQSGTFAEIYETKQGREIWQFLNEQSSVELMKASSDKGEPAILGVESLLISDFQVSERTNVTEKDKAQFDRFKQMLGSMVCQVMRHHGYKLPLKGNTKKTPSSKVFSSSSFYIKNN